MNQATRSILVKLFILFLVLVGPDLSRSLRAEVVATSLVLTSSELAINNLESQIASAREMIQRRPSDPIFQKQLFDLLSTRSQFLGSYFDFRELKQLAEAQPQTVEGFLLRSRYYSTIHEFRRALDELRQAETIDPGNQEIRRQKARVKTALRQDLPELRAEQAQVLAENSNYTELVIMAAIESELGNFKSANRFFASALDSYRDASPFPVAFIQFQRGVMWAEKAGRSDIALGLYEEATRYLPQYVVATVHHAELIHENGNTEAGIARLRKVIGSTDPEPRGLLGELLRLVDQDQEAAGLVASANRDYDTLLGEFPFAFADHGSEFFTGPGENPQRGFELAKLNLSNRKNERAYIVALQAAQEAKIPSEEYCTLVREARSLPPVYIPLQELVDPASAPHCP